MLRDGQAISQPIPGYFYDNAMVIPIQKEEETRQNQMQWMEPYFCHPSSKSSPWNSLQTNSGRIPLGLRQNVA